MKKGIVFDLGGTLMEYRGMPLSWASYYKDGFQAVSDRYSLHLSESDIERSAEVLKEYNPRYRPREAEYPPAFLFWEAAKHWHAHIPAEEMIDAFFGGLKLSAEIYPDTIPSVTRLKKEGYLVAALTNLPSAMPDYLFRKDIAPILSLLDFYVSSETCGFRKPNPAGLFAIAKNFNMNAAELIFAGDEKIDIEAAKRAGCQSVLIDRNHSRADYGQDYCIEQLDDLFYWTLRPGGF